MKKICYECGGKGYIEFADYDYEENILETGIKVTCDNCQGEGYVEVNSNSYLVTIMGKEYKKIIIDIENTVNRPNNPDDNSIIDTYIRYHYRDILYDVLLMEKAHEVIKIYDDWNIEDYK